MLSAISFWSFTFCLTHVPRTDILPSRYLLTSSSTARISTVLHLGNCEPTERCGREVTSVRKLAGKARRFERKASRRLSSAHSSRASTTANTTLRRPISARSSSKRSFSPGCVLFATCFLKSCRASSKKKVLASISCAQRLPTRFGSVCVFRSL